MRVLLADDSALARRLLVQMLGRWGHEAVVCVDGEQAWTALQEKDAPVVAILDWEMPKLSGVELCRRIRAAAKEPYVYVVLLTANERKEGVIEGLAAGADDYIRKPFDEQELEVRIRAGQRITDLQTALVSAREALRAQASHDSLTGLWNRGAILERLRAELTRSGREGASLAVLMVDLDHFKNVNDTLGHLGGDAVLREVSRRMQSVIRSYDAAGRYGGEEFLVLLPGCDLDAARVRADQLRLAIGDRPMTMDGRELSLTASVGVAVRRRGTDGNPDALVKAADDALYRAKDAGRNRVELEIPPS